MLYGLGVTIGAGIYVLLSAAAQKAGVHAPMAFVCASVVMGFSAASFAELSARIPVSAGEAAYVHLGFGSRKLSALVGFLVIASGTVSSAAIEASSTGYIREFVDVPPSFLVVAIVLMLSAVAAWGIVESVLFAGIFTVFEAGALLVIVGAGVWNEPQILNELPRIVPSLGDSAAWAGIAGAGLLAFFAFIGFDIVATTAEETKQPQRDIPRGILASLGIVTVLYVAVAIVLSGMVSYTQLRDAETQNLATAFALNGIDWAAKVISIGALAGLTTVVIVLVLGQTRVLFAMSRDGLLPTQLAKTGRHGTPVRITLIVGLVVAVTATVFPIDKLEEMVNIGTLFAFVLVSAGVIVLRRTRPDLQRGFRVPWVPVLPILAIIACLWLMLNLTGLTWIRFGIWMAIGVVVYFLYGRRHSILANRAR